MVRFREWCHAEGYVGSSALLKYYQDTIAQIELFNEIAVSTLSYITSGNVSRQGEKGSLYTKAIGGPGRGRPEWISAG
jgi:hypothetical protein